MEVFSKRIDDTYQKMNFNWGKMVKNVLEDRFAPCPRKVFLPYLFKAYYTAQEIDGHRSWNIGSCTTVCISRPPDISISNRTILYVPRNAISPYAARAIYFVFPGEHIFCHRKYVSIWRGAWWTRYNRHCSETFLFSPFQMEYFLNIKIFDIMIECKNIMNLIYSYT